MKPTFLTESDMPSSRAPLWWVAALLVSSWACYFNSLWGAFVFDDRNRISDNSAVWNAGWWNGPRGLVDFTFALNYLVGGLNPFGFRAVNVAIHTATGLALFGLVRRTLLGSTLTVPLRSQAASLAFAVSLIWLVHPLNTEAVTYVVQRYESLAALWYVLALYAFCRGVQSSSRQSAWFALTLLCYAAGWRSKETIVTLPIVLCWYDRALWAESWRTLWLRKGFYSGLLVLTALLGWQVILSPATSVAQQLIGSAPANPADFVGPEKSAVEVEGLSPTSYLLTQPGVIWHYLALSFWPVGLCLDYDWPIARSATAIVPPMVGLAGIFIAILWAIPRRPGLAFVAGACFLYLAPTSSILPIKDIAVEHRMYAPLAAVTVLAVFAASSLFARASTSPGMRICVLAIVALALGSQTILRNIDYRSNVAIWDATVRARPQNARAHVNLGFAYHDLNRDREALAELSQAATIDPVRYTFDLGQLLHILGDDQRAMQVYRRSIELHRRDFRGQINLAKLLHRHGEIAEAETWYRRALSIAPGNPIALCGLAAALLDEKRPEESLPLLEKSLTVDPRYLRARLKLAEALVQLDRIGEAISQLRIVAAAEPGNTAVHFALGSLLLEHQDYAEAALEFEVTIALDPQNQEAQRMLRESRNRRRG